MIINRIQALYRDKDDLFRTVIKQIYEEQIGTNELSGKWKSSTRMANHSIGTDIPPEWEFQSEVWAYERKPVLEAVYDYESEVQIIREQIGVRTYEYRQIQL